MRLRAIERGVVGIGARPDGIESSMLLMTGTTSVHGRIIASPPLLL
jgi:hypothetical protein